MKLCIAKSYDIFNIVFIFYNIPLDVLKYNRSLYNTILINYYNLI